MSFFKLINNGISVKYINNVQFTKMLDSSKLIILAVLPNYYYETRQQLTKMVPVIFHGNY